MPDFGKDFLVNAKFGLSNAESARIEQLKNQSARLSQGQKNTELKALHPSAAAKDTPKEMEKAATDFEALLLHQMLNAMWSTVPKDGLLSGSNEEEIYTDMLSDALARNIADKQSIGIADALLKDMKKKYGVNK